MVRLSCTLNTSTNRSACTARPTWLPWPRGVAVSAGVCPGAARSRSAGRRFESPTPGNGRCLHGFTAHALGLIAQRPRRWGGHIGRQPSVALEATAFESPRGMRNGVFQGLRAVLGQSPYLIHGQVCGYIGNAAWWARTARHKRHPGAGRCNIIHGASARPRLYLLSSPPLFLGDSDRRNHRRDRRSA